MDQETFNIEKENAINKMDHSLEMLAHSLLDSDLDNEFSKATYNFYLSVANEAKRQLENTRI